MLCCVVAGWWWVFANIIYVLGFFLWSLPVWNHHMPTFLGFSFNLCCWQLHALQVFSLKEFFVYIQSGDHPSIGTCRKSGYKMSYMKYNLLVFLLFLWLHIKIIISIQQILLIISHLWLLKTFKITSILSFNFVFWWSSTNKKKFDAHMQSFI